MTPIFPIAIQCTTEKEARRVARTLQGIVDASPPGADYKQLLAAFDIPSVGYNQVLVLVWLLT